jgi:predicted RNase H-like HicB family nuclease
MKLRIEIEVLENGYTVEVPDVKKYNEMEAASKKSKGPMPYMGDCMKEYAAKTPAEVLKLVKSALTQLPDVAYADAFDEAAKEMKG